MDKILEYLKTYNERHPEHKGMVGVMMMDDGSGNLIDVQDQIIWGTGFANLEEFKIVCETK